jgi:glycyl-tRNA synthetase
MEYLAKEREILERMGKSLGNGDLEDVKALIEELEIAVLKQVQEIGLM